jgi:hypothetical protein
MTNMPICDYATIADALAGTMPLTDHIGRERDKENLIIDELAESLHHKMWHLEPSHPDDEWISMDEEEREFYRILVRDLLQGLRPYGLRRPLTTQ